MKPFTKRKWKVFKMPKKTRRGKSADYITTIGDYKDGYHTGPIVIYNLNGKNGEVWELAEHIVKIHNAGLNYD